MKKDKRPQHTPALDKARVLDGLEGAATGAGAKFNRAAIDKILAARRHGQLRIADLARLTPRIGGIKSFITTPDWRPRRELDCAQALGAPAGPQQLDLFSA